MAFLQRFPTMPNNDVWCRHIPLINWRSLSAQDPGEEEVTFCSMNCMNQFLQTAPQLEELEEEEEDNSNSGSTSTIIMEPGEEPDAEEEPDRKMEVDTTSGSAFKAGKQQLHGTGSPKRSVPVTEALSISTSSPALSASATTQPGTPTTPTAGPSSFSSPAASPAHSSLLSPGLRAGAQGSPHQALLSPSQRGKEERVGKRHRRSSSTASQDGYTVKVRGLSPLWRVLVSRYPILVC